MGPQETVRWKSSQLWRRTLSILTCLDSPVNTYTIGFNIEPEGAVFLDHLARAGGGEFYPADSAQDLSVALNSAITDIQSSSESFTELSVDVDKTTFSHNNRVYYSVFSPSKRQAWRGNLKGYFVDSTGIVDINGAEAVEDNIIRNEAQSFWSSVADGADIDARWRFRTDGDGKPESLYVCRRQYSHGRR